MGQAYVERKKVIITGGSPYAIDISGNSKVGVVTNGTWNGSAVGIAFGGTGATDVANARTNLGLAVGTNVQAYSSTLDAVANGTYSGDDSISTVGTVTTGTWQASVVGVAYGGTGANTLTGYVKANGTSPMTASSTIPAADVEGLSNAVSNLVSTSLEVSNELSLTYDSGNDVVVIAIDDPNLLAVANGTYSGDDSITTVGTVTTGTWNASTVAIAYGGTGATDAANARINLGLQIGTNVQAYDAELAALASVTSAADKVPYFTGSGTADVATLSSFGRSLIDDADASAARTTLGLGTMAVQDASNVNITGGSITANTLTVSGNLTVNGTTTTINSTTVSVDDKNMTLGDTANPTDATADGGGITLKGTTDKTFNWVDATDSWTSSENLDVAAGKTYKVGGTDVLSNTTLGSGVVNSSLTSVGTVTTGTWNASTVAIAYGGTGATDAANARTNLGLAIGTNVQAYSSTLDAVANGTYSGDDSITTVGTVTSGTWNASTVAIAYGGTGATDAANARVNLGLQIGTNVQAYDAELAALASVTSAADKVPYFTGSGTANVTTLSSFGRSLIDDADASAARTTLGVAIGTNVQAYSSTLDALANGSYSGDDNITTVGTVTSGTWNASTIAIAYGGTGATDAANARTNLGLAIGTNVQAYSSTLDAVANGTYSGDDSITTVGTVTSGTWNASTVAIAYGGTGATDAANARINLGLQIGTNVQAYDAELAALASVTSAADKVPYFTGSGTADVATLSSFGRSLIDDADASAGRTTLGLGTMAVQDASNVNITGGTITANTLTVSGNLTVNGTTTTINSTTVSVDDKNMTLGDTASPTDATADGGGITLKGTTDKTFNWVDATDSWTSSEHLDVAAGKVYKVGGTEVLSNTTLGSGVVNSSLTSVGTVTTGTWNASTVAIAYGGTGATDAANARTNLGLAIGTNVQAYSSTLDAVANGTYSGDDSITTVGTLTTGTWNASIIAVAYGGTGANNAPDARTNLGLGTISTQSASNVSITGGTIGGLTSLSIEGVFNAGLTLASNTYSNAKVSVRTPVVNFKTVAETNLFTVPTGYMFLIDSMEVLTTSISGASTAPDIRFGNTGDSSAYYSAATTLSNGVGARHVIDIPQDGVVANTVVTFGISSASTATAHQGVGIVTGYLVKLS